MFKFVAGTGAKYTVVNALVSTHTVHAIDNLGRVDHDRGDNHSGFRVLPDPAEMLPWDSNRYVGESLLRPFRSPHARRRFLTAAAMSGA